MTQTNVPDKLKTYIREDYNAAEERVLRGIKLLQSGEPQRFELMISTLLFIYFFYWGVPDYGC